MCTKTNSFVAPERLTSCHIPQSTSAEVSSILVRQQILFYPGCNPMHTTKEECTKSRVFSVMTPTLLKTQLTYNFVNLNKYSEEKSCIKVCNTFMQVLLYLSHVLLLLSVSSNDPIATMAMSFPSWQGESQNQAGNHSEITKNSNNIAGYLTSQWLTRFVPSLHTLVVGFSLPLNILAIYILVVKIKPMKPARVYMLNLASTDVLFVSVLPLKISYHFSGNNWMLGSEMCRFLTATFYCNMYCSILLMTAISVDRFLALVYPMQSLSWRTLRRASVLCCAIWITAIAATIPLLITEQTKMIPQLNITTCHDVLDAFVIMETFRYYASALSVIFFFTPLIISTTCYVCIIRNLSSSNVAAKPKKRRRAILLSIAVLCAFMVSFGPTNVLLLVRNVRFSHDQHLEMLHFAYLLAVGVGTLNCCIDPVIYYYASSKCQREVRNILCCKKQLEQRSNTSSKVMTFSSGFDRLSQA